MMYSSIRQISFKQRIAVGMMACLLGSAVALPATGKTVKICGILPTSGANAATGIGMMNSMDLAVKQLNASGKLGDIQLELVKLDDASLAATGVNAALKAAADPEVLACSAHWNSPVALATRDIFHREGLANLVPAAINWRLTAEQKGDEIFRIAPPDNWQLEAAAKLPIEQGKKSFYLIDDNTQYGKSLVSEMEKYVVPLGGSKLGSDSIAVGEKDFTAVLTKAKELKPDFIFFGGVTTEAALIRQQMVRLGLNAFYYTGSGTISPTFATIAGQAADGTNAYFYGLPYPAYPGGKAFVAAYDKGGYEKGYETYGIWSYASVEILGEAIKRAAAHDKLTRRGIIDELKSGTFATALGPISFLPSGDVKERVMAYYRIEGGKWVMDYGTSASGGLQKVDPPQPIDVQ